MAGLLVQFGHPLDEASTMGTRDPDDSLIQLLSTACSLNSATGTANKALQPLLYWVGSLDFKLFGSPHISF